MAKRKSNKGATPSMQPPSMPERKSVETEKAENGFIVRVTHEGKKGYQCKKFVAFSQPEAQRISGIALMGGGKKGSGKKKASKTKVYASKKV